MPWWVRLSEGLAGAQALGRAGTAKRKARLEKESCANATPKGSQQDALNADELRPQPQTCADLETRAAGLARPGEA
ncbi:MAG: hypothetical protein CTY29_06700 [Methylobacter sp.]|nr:MAG: hypothetical protein CTY29_06700 [Methylobacter sp.]